MPNRLAAVEDKMVQLPVLAQVFSAFLTPLIAIIVAYIAYRQHLTARAKL